MYDTSPVIPEPEVDTASIELFYQRLLSLDCEAQIEPALAEVLRRICDVTRSSLVYVELFGEGDTPPLWRGHTVNDIPADELRSQISYNIIRRTIAERRTVESSSSSNGESVVELATLRQQETSRIICVPLGKLLPIGAIYVRASHAFSTAERGRIESAARRITRVALRLFDPGHAIGRALAEEVRALQDSRISEAMERHDGNIAMVARSLGVGRAFVYRVLERLLISSPPRSVSG